MVYRGIARGKIIELEDEVSLPEGTEVEVLIKQGEIGETMLGGHPKGSLKALLAALKLPAQCTPEDVEALVQSMQRGRQPVRFEGILNKPHTSDLLVGHDRVQRFNATGCRCVGALSISSHRRSSSHPWGSVGNDGQ